MALKIICKGTTKFFMTCATCETAYSYELEDLGVPTNSSFVVCPCCGMANYHYQRDRIYQKDEEDG